MKYCQDGIDVYYDTDEQEYTWWYDIYGHYEIQPDDVNGRPYFKSVRWSYGIWWVNGQWTFSTLNDIGTISGFAFSNYQLSNCPYQLENQEVWSVEEASGWETANKDLLIRCMFLNYNYLKVLYIYLDIHITKHCSNCHSTAERSTLG